MGPGGRARGGSGGEGRSGASGLIEVVVRDGVGLGGVRVRSLIEVVRGVLLDDLVGVVGAELEGEFGLGRSPGGEGLGGEVGSPVWVRIWAMGWGSVRSAMKVRGAAQVGQVRGEVS